MGAWEPLRVELRDFVIVHEPLTSVVVSGVGVMLNSVGVGKMADVVGLIAVVSLEVPRLGVAILFSMEVIRRVLVAVDNSVPS